MDQNTIRVQVIGPFELKTQKVNKTKKCIFQVVVIQYSYFE